jgi:hypothetical protein
MCFMSEVEQGKEKIQRPAADLKALEIGDKMVDGTFYAGISPDTNKPMYVTPADATVLMDFNQAAQYAGNLNFGGHQDYRIPSRAEWEVLQENCEKGSLKGTFNLTGSSAGGRWVGWYVSSTSLDTTTAWQQRLSDGWQYYYRKDCAASVRCVR